MEEPCIASSAYMNTPMEMVWSIARHVSSTVLVDYYSLLATVAVVSRHGGVNYWAPSILLFLPA
jgi:hypothetical protein